MTFQTTPNIFWKLRSPTKSGPLSTDPPTTHSSPFLTIRQTQLATFHLKCSLHQIHQFSFTWVTRFTRITQFARITRIDKGRVQKKNSYKAVRSGHPPPAWPLLFCENFDPFCPLQNGKITPNMTTCPEFFTFSWPLRGRGGTTQAVSLTAFYEFFWWLPLFLKVILQN